MSKSSRAADSRRRCVAVSWLDARMRTVTFVWMERAIRRERMQIPRKPVHPVRKTLKYYLDLFQVAEFSCEINE